MNLNISCFDSVDCLKCLYIAAFLPFSTLDKLLWMSPGAQEFHHRNTGEKCPVLTSYQEDLAALAFIEG